MDDLRTASRRPGDEFLFVKDTSVTKVTSEFSPHGPQGEKYLASGTQVAMRLWENEKPNDKKPISRNPYETVGYVLKGKAELHLEGQTLILNAGDSWTVPKNANHTYKILESFSAIEATSPPAHAHEAK
jgi:quercetin dioxygenase-like cupin family protein